MDVLILKLIATNLRHIIKFDDLMGVHESFITDLLTVLRPVYHNTKYHTYYFNYNTEVMHEIETICKKYNCMYRIEKKTDARYEDENWRAANHIVDVR